jgi:hypothetical protein
MADHLNQTLSYYVSNDKKVRRKYTLDVNPHARQRQHGQGTNVIDARWIDIRNGLYIDITGLSELQPDSEPGVLSCKNFHKYNTTDLYPMRESVYEGVPAKVPYKYSEVLISEYGRMALVATQFEDHNWSPELKAWVPDREKMAEKKRKMAQEKGKTKGAEKD